MTASRDERLAEAVQLRENGELEQARQALLALRAEFPRDARIAVQTAWVHDSMGLEEDAVRHYEAAIAGGLPDDELRPALLGLGSTYRALGRDADSDRTLREGVERFPDFRPLRVFHALTAYNRGRSREAVEQLVKVLLESTSDPAILRYRRSLAAYADDLDRSWLALPAMVPEASLEQTEHGSVAKGDGWFVLNARDARWRPGEGRGAYCRFEGEPEFAQVGIHLVALGPGEPMSMYHWEADQEDFLVLAGEALLIIEGEERPLRQWDFVHCPPEAKHTILGAGEGPCLVLAVGARDRSTGPDWGGYSVDEAALRHGAGVEHETSDAEQAYARFPARETARYREGWLPD